MWRGVKTLPIEQEGDIRAETTTTKKMGKRRGRRGNHAQDIM